MPAVGRFLGTGLMGKAPWPGRRRRLSRPAVGRQPLRFRYRATRRRRRTLLNRCR